MKFLKILAVSLAVFTPAQALADGECQSTHECAQRMVDALAGLNAVDEATRNGLIDLAKQIQELDAARQEADAAILARAKAHTDGKLRVIGNGADEVPTWGTSASPECPAGSYMVGARVNVASGGNAGALYSGIRPICRKFVLP